MLGVKFIKYLNCLDMVTSSKLNSKRNIMSKLVHIFNKVYGYFGLFRLLKCATMIYFCALLTVAM